MGERRANAFTVSSPRADAPVQLRESWAMAGSMETSRTTRVQGRVLTAATPPALCPLQGRNDLLHIEPREGGRRALAAWPEEALRGGVTEKVA